MATQSLESWNDREEEYLSAQRAAVEAVEIGQETLAESARQGEQLSNAERLADRTQYALDKSARILRGMTWSGWVANMMTKDVAEKDYDKTAQAPPQTPSLLLTYDDVTGQGRAAAQAILNFQCNLVVLESCETVEQRETCHLVCEDVYDKASKEVSQLHASGNHALVKRFLSDLSALRQRQKACKQRPQDLTSSKPSQKQQSPLVVASPKDPVTSRQDEHLEFISSSLGDLHSIAQSLSEVMGNQNKIIDSLDEKSDAILEKSKMVTRRADRLTQQKSWTPAKKTFHATVSIRHLRTGCYVANLEGRLVLVEKFYRDTCSFDLWKRQNDIFGLRNRYSNRWVGQTLVGSLSCTSSSFGTRDEWQADDNWKKTPLLCCSAGWGSGNYLMVRSRDNAIYIGGSGVETKKIADLWSLEEAGD